MAYFEVTTGFDAAAFNLNRPVSAGYTFESFPGGSLSFGDNVGIGGSFPGALFVANLSISMSYSEAAFLSGAASGNGSMALWGVNFAYDAQNLLSAGQVRGLFQRGPGLEFQVLGIAQNSGKLTAALRSADTADDLALLQTWLSGNDFVTLRGLDDVIAAGTGDDFITDEGGRNDLSGGDGRDVISAGNGRDTMLGEAGNDMLISMGGADDLSGGLGDDLIWAGAGKDRISGGAGRDSFFFDRGDKDAVITDFSLAEDQIIFMGSARARGEVGLQQAEAGTLVSFSNVSVLLRGVDLADLTGFDVAVSGRGLLQKSLQDYFAAWEFMP